MARPDASTAPALHVAEPAPPRIGPAQPRVQVSFLANVDGGVRRIVREVDPAALFGEGVDVADIAGFFINYPWVPHGRGWREFGDVGAPAWF